MGEKALEDLLYEEEIVKNVELQNRISDVNMAHLMAYGTPYIPRFVMPP